MQAIDVVVCSKFELQEGCSCQHCGVIGAAL
jgi:hypothetical protein